MPRNTRARRRGRRNVGSTQQARQPRGWVLASQRLNKQDAAAIQDQLTAARSSLYRVLRITKVATPENAPQLRELLLGARQELSGIINSLPTARSRGRGRRQRAFA